MCGIFQLVSLVRSSSKLCNLLFQLLYPAVPITTASGCRLANGTVVAVGVSFQQGPCKRCVCHSSGVAASCFVIDCPRPPTCMTGYRLTTRPGACCPSCTCLAQSHILTYISRYLDPWIAKKGGKFNVDQGLTML